VRCAGAETCVLNCAGTRLDCGKGVQTCNAPCPP
jgi:hypothetical protein